MKKLLLGLSLLFCMSNICEAISKYKIIVSTKDADIGYIIKGSQKYEIMADSASTPVITLSSSTANFGNITVQTSSITVSGKITLSDGTILISTSMFGDMKKATDGINIYNSTTTLQTEINALHISTGAIAILQTGSYENIRAGTATISIGLSGNINTSQINAGSLSLTVIASSIAINAINNEQMANYAHFVNTTTAQNIDGAKTFLNLPYIYNFGYITNQDSSLSALYRHIRLNLPAQDGNYPQIGVQGDQTIVNGGMTFDTSGIHFQTAYISGAGNPYVNSWWDMNISGYLIGNNSLNARLGVGITPTEKIETNGNVKGVNFISTGFFQGDGSQLTNLTPANVSAGSLPSTVIVSSFPYTSNFSDITLSSATVSGNITFSDGTSQKTADIIGMSNVTYTAYGNTAFSTATFVAVTLAANTTYQFNSFIIFQSTNIAIGIYITLNGNVAPIYIQGTGAVQTSRFSSIGIGPTNCNSYLDGISGTTTEIANTDQIGYINGLICTGASATTLNLNFRAESSLGVVSVMRGSYLRAFKLQ